MAKDKLTDKIETKIQCFTCKGGGSTFVLTHEDENNEYWDGEKCTSCNGNGSITIQ